MKTNKTKETWAPAKYIRTDGTILDFTGLYEVSDHGRIRSLNYMHTGKTRELKQSTAKAKDGSIWYSVILYKNNKKYFLPTHRVVLSSFRQSEYFPNAVADHIISRDESNCCNLLSNLRWFTVRQNGSTQHCKESISKAITNHPSLSKQVRVTLADGTQQYFPSANEAGRSLGISPKMVSTIITQLGGYYKKLNLHFGYVK